MRVAASPQFQISAIIPLSLMSNFFLAHVVNRSILVSLSSCEMSFPTLNERVNLELIVNMHESVSNMPCTNSEFAMIIFSTIKILVRLSIAKGTELMRFVMDNPVT
ncbi:MULTISPECIES: hypothetical protein [unclassified Shewanella]|uniref:hypothetical protein n=1 Tax=Shewanella TaxID=22 RepID=UPI0021D910D6|nr:MULTISPECIES: hypothetical protein [unclassified Shewanella]MCU7962123.1 hypothetical protein [Shewanella sp. SW32]MCU7970055.1 hypothetical protein [Shewanella sp. SW29]MCU8014964.1 hypothetical protein [Shewanella sp. SM74]MCU8056153.1 hypothetical protein [Shewanella sp. SM35]MCU8065087.1 hypothetical protein [Shewanella sp. SM34]